MHPEANASWFGSSLWIKSFIEIDVVSINVYISDVQCICSSDVQKLDSLAKFYELHSFHTQFVACCFPGFFFFLAEVSFHHSACFCRGLLQTKYSKIKVEKRGKITKCFL